MRPRGTDFNAPSPAQGSLLHRARQGRRLFWFAIRSAGTLGRIDVRTKEINLVRCLHPEAHQPYQVSRSMSKHTCGHCGVLTRWRATIRAMGMAFLTFRTAATERATSRSPTGRAARSDPAVYPARQVCGDYLPPTGVNCAEGAAEGIARVLMRLVTATSSLKEAFAARMIAADDFHFLWKSGRVADLNRQTVLDPTVFPEHSKNSTCLRPYHRLPR